VGESRAYVVDACVLLRFLQGERGAERVARVLRSAASAGERLGLHIINLGEVVYTVGKHLGWEVAEKTRTEIGLLPLEVVGWSDSLFWHAVALKAHHAMSYGDCFAAALAIERGATLLTSDPEFKAVASLVAVERL